MRRRQQPVTRYLLGTDDRIIVPRHGKLLRRLGFRGSTTIHLASIHRAPKGARRDRDRAVIDIHIL